MQTSPTAGAVDAEAWRERAAALLPRIEAAARRIDAERELPADLVGALHEAELYRMLLPRRYGGGEVDPLTFFEVLERIAAVDASTAWCLGQSSGCSMSAAYLEETVAREVFGARDAVLCWGPPQGGVTPRAERVEGGYRVSGTWTFASGSRHATWLRAQALAPEPLQVLFPRASATIHDVWHVVGLRGTGSDTYAVDNLFVPSSHAYVRDLARRREPGPLYRFSIVNLYAIGFAGVALGIARATLDAFYALAREKKPRAARAVLRDDPVVQSQVGVTEARLRAARAFLVDAVRTAWDGAVGGESPTFDQRAAMRMASTHAIRTAKEIVDVAYQAAGASALFEDGPFERRFRDVNAVTQQIQGHLANFEPVGKHLLGLPTELNI
jgi:alkylation response protein AidB-like acyl-CoA dehydrogenase